MSSPNGDDSDFDNSFVIDTANLYDYKFDEFLEFYAKSNAKFYEFLEQSILSFAFYDFLLKLWLGYE